MMNQLDVMNTKGRNQLSLWKVFVLDGSLAFRERLKNRVVFFARRWLLVVLCHQFEQSLFVTLCSLSHLSLVESRCVLLIVPLKRTHLESLDFPSRHLFGSISWLVPTCVSLVLISCSWYLSLHSTLAAFATGVHVLVGCIDHCWFYATVNFSLNQPTSLDGSKAVSDYASSQCHSILWEYLLIEPASFVDGFYWAVEKCLGVTVQIFELLNLDDHPNAGGSLIHTPKNEIKIV